MKVYQGVPKRVVMGRLKKGTDLLQSLEKLVRTENIKWGILSVIGALQRTKLGYYNQDLKQYQTKVLEPNLEITACMGNISVKEGQPMVHAHITLADADGRAYGGHLVPGNAIFAAEYWITEYEGEGPIRSFERDTELFLWS